MPISTTLIVPHKLWTVYYSSPHWYMHVHVPESPWWTTELTIFLVCMMVCAAAECDILFLAETWQHGIACVEEKFVRLSKAMIAEGRPSWDQVSRLLLA